MDAPNKTLPVGTLIGGAFEIKAVLGQGASAVVYRARHQITEKDVALKLLHKNAFGTADNQRKGRFENEAKTASQVNHPNIVKLLSFGFHEEAPFLVMELVNGSTLEQHLASQGRLSIPQFQRVFGDLLSGLDSLHQAQIIHRDIKPGNILLEHGLDNEIVPKLSDFGLAKGLHDEVTQNLTATNEIPGTPAYMSPEQCQKGELSPRSDIYALGCVMYEALTLEPI
jgi:serine/threonine-protein kinase